MLLRSKQKWSMESKTRDSSLKSIDIHVDALVPNEFNVNEMDDVGIARLRDEIDEVGFISPIQVIPMNDGRYRILGGEHRWKAAKLAGYEYVPSVVMEGPQWSEEDFVDLVTFRLNAIHGSSNTQKLAILYDRMAKKFGQENLQYIMGITQVQQWNKIKKSVIAQLKISSDLPKDIQKQIEKAEKAASSPDQFGKNLNKILKARTDQLDSSFLVFSHGRKEHVLIGVNESNFLLAKEIGSICSSAGQDINQIMEPLLLQIKAGLSQ